MKNIKLKVNTIKNSIKNKFNKIKEKIINTKNSINETKINSLSGYGAIIFVGGILVGVNISNFMLCLSDQYPKLNVSVNQEVASLKQANDVIKENTDTIKPIIIINIEDIKYSDYIIEKKIEYKKILLDKAGTSINKISIEKRKKYLNQIDAVLIKINNLTVDKTDNINTFTYKLLALKEILESSLESINSEEEEFEFNSAKELDEEGKNLEEGKKEEEVEIKQDEIEKKVIVTPIVKVIPKEEKEIEEVKEEEVEIKKEVVIPVIKEEPKIEVKEEVAPIVKEEPKVETKEEIAPVVKTIVNNTDSISLSINKQINSSLDSLNAQIFNDFKIKVLKNDNLVLENGVWYTYVYSQYKNFGKGITPSEADLKRSGLDKNTTVLLLDNTAGASFAVEYTKVKLISDYIISNITNKHVFLTQLIDDKRYLHGDTDNLFISLKTTTQNLTSGASRANKISKIYAYLLGNISYSTQFSLANKNIFSGIITYKDKVGICGGYTKLNLYMLSFAGITDAKVVKGYVIDAPDFPSIGHSWIQIGYQYYDPTFDDPVGASKTKSYSEYKYFGLPRDLFYTNRFNYGTLPSYLKTESLSSRKNLIKENIAKLSTKYKDNNYILVKPFTFRTDNNLTATETLTIEKIKNIIPSFDVSEYKFIQDGVTKTITNIDYYTVNDSNIETLLEQLNYNIDGYKLFKWDDGSYRLAYNSTIK